MGRAKHVRLPRLPEHITERDCERVASHSGFPLALVSAVLRDGHAITPALADRLRKALHRSDSARVSSRAVKPAIELSEPAQRYGLPPEGYEGPIVIPVAKLEPDMLLMVSDRLVTGWLRVTKKPVKNNSARHELVIATESADVISAKNASVRVAMAMRDK